MYHYTPENQMKIIYKFLVLFVTFVPSLVRSAQTNQQQTTESDFFKLENLSKSEQQQYRNIISRIKARDQYIETIANQLTPRILHWGPNLTFSVLINAQNIDRELLAALEKINAERRSKKAS